MTSTPPPDEPAKPAISGWQPRPSTAPWPDPTSADATAGGVDRPAVGQPAQGQYGAGQPAPSQYGAGQPGQYQPAGYYPPPPAAGYPSTYGGPAPYGSLYPYPVPTRRRTDGFSIASLILGALSAIPLAVVFGIVGLVRTKAHARRGRWMAVLGLVLALGWTVVVVSVVVARHAGQASRASDGSVTKAGTISPYDIRVGDCTTMHSGTTKIHSITVVPCSQLHNAQAFGDVTATDASYPGPAALQQESVNLCLPKARAFLGVTVSGLGLGAFYPSSAAWHDGSRTLHCVLFDPDKSITGDIRADR